MPGESGLNDQNRRLNPFAFPAETNGRFTLLVVAALMLVWMLGNFFFVALEAEGIISPTLPGEIGLPEFSTLDSAELNAVIAALNQEVANGLLYVALPVALTLAVFGLAAAIYRTHPLRIRRRKHLQPLSPERDAAFIDNVNALVELAGITPRPSIEMAAKSRAVDGQAFGLRNRYVLRLGGRLRLLMRKAPDRFRAIVLHELAHIANRDVGRTYFAQALWVAVAALTIAPLLAYLLFLFVGTRVQEIVTEGLANFDWLRLLTVSLPNVVLIVLQVALTLAVVAAIRASVLRVREIYADWRAALWGAEAPLVSILQADTSGRQGGRIARLLRLHPTGQERVASLRDPSMLFQTTRDLPLFAGLLLALVIGGMVAIGPVLAIMVGSAAASIWLRLAQFTSAFSPSLTQFLITVVGPFVALILPLGVALILFLAAAYLVAGTVGVEVQREGVAAWAANRRGCGSYIRLLLPALLVALGLEIGFAITPTSPLAPLSNTDASNRLLSLGLGLALMPVWVLGVTGLMWLWLAFTRYFAARLLGTHTGHQSPQGKRRLFTLVLSVLLWILLLPAVVGQLIVAGTITGDAAGFLPVESLPITLGIGLGLYALAFAAMWMFTVARNAFATPRCDNCQHPAAHKVVVGHHCKNCGHDLAPWLFANPAPPIG